jgi:hypothetical protein
MTCPNCGESLLDDCCKCPMCGTTLKPASAETVSGETSMMSTVCFLLAAAVFVLFLIATIAAWKVGSAVADVESFGEDTLLGSYYKGVSMAFLASGISFSCILIWLGLKNNN